MKIFTALFCLILSTSALAQPVGASKYGYLTKEDQKHFKNDIMEGKNQLERIDLNVKEINNLHTKIKTMEADIILLKKEIDLLKSKK